jgi:hypothetical protein
MAHMFNKIVALECSLWAVMYENISVETVVLDGYCHIS